jgi:hypothetical protein
MQNIYNTGYLNNVHSSVLTTNFQAPQYWSNYYIENGSFLRMDNINLGYNVGSVFNKKASLRLSAIVQNAFVITNYSGIDPEVSSGIDKYESIISLCLRTKQWFIEVDEFDHKERLLLNFGHTFGHAIEGASNFEIPHGVAVGIGMLAAISFARSYNKLEPNQNRVKQLETYILNIFKEVGSYFYYFFSVD